MTTLAIVMAADFNIQLDEGDVWECSCSKNGSSSGNWDATRKIARPSFRSEGWINFEGHKLLSISGNAKHCTKEWDNHLLKHLKYHPEGDHLGVVICSPGLKEGMPRYGHPAHLNASPR